MSMLKAAIVPVVLLTISNAFMTVAWYGHLKFRKGRQLEGDRRKLADCVL